MSNLALFKSPVVCSHPYNAHKSFLWAIGALTYDLLCYILIMPVILSNWLCPFMRLKKFCKCMAFFFFLVHLIFLCYIQYAGNRLLLQEGHCGKSSCRKTSQRCYSWGAESTFLVKVSQSWGICWAFLVFCSHVLDILSNVFIGVPLNDCKYCGWLPFLRFTLK